MSVTTGCNLRNSIVEVCHAELGRVSDSSSYRSWCPVCNEGILLVSRPIWDGVDGQLRHFNGAQISRSERCTLCGQGFWYTDEQIAGEKFHACQPRQINQTWREILESAGQAAARPRTAWERLLGDER